MEETKPLSLYVHIPFCDRLCSYCDFPKYLSREDLKEQYLAALLKELDSIPAGSLQTVYIGGGTPSCLSCSQLRKLLSYLWKKFGPWEEATMEANPESLSEDKIAVLEQYHINRVSLGAQSFNKRILKILNREEETEEKVREAVINLHKHHIDNINVDFIYGLKEEKRDDFVHEISVGKELGLTHFSFYSLQIEENTPLFYHPEVQKDQDGLGDDYDFIRKTLKENGYLRYEVSNFSKPSYESKHNLTYWRNEPYYAAGLGATSYVNGVRATRTRNLFHYLKDYRSELQEIKENAEDQEFDYLMLHLRLKEGFSLSDFKSRFHKDFLKEYKNELNKTKDYLDIKDDRVSVKDNDLYILDAILVDLLHFPN